MMQTAFSDKGTNTTLHVVADNSTVHSLIESVATKCALANTALTAVPLSNTSVTDQPRPEQAVQYYRASSAVLTLDGYVNAATFDSDANATNTPISGNLDFGFINCVNQSIGSTIPLVESNGALGSAQHFAGISGLLWLGWLVACFIA